MTAEMLVNGAGTPPPARSTLEREMAKRFVQDASGGIAGHPAAGLVALILFYDHAGLRPALIWFGALLLATVVRVLLSRRAGHADPGSPEATARVRWGVVAVALAWGAGGILFGTTIPAGELGILLVILAGLVAAGTATLVADTRAFYTFSTILLGSVLVAVLLRDSEMEGLLLVALVLTFWLVMSVLHRNAHRQLLDSLDTRLQLRAAQWQYQGLVESARDLVWQVDTEGKWTFLNAAAGEIYGVSPEELLGTPALERVLEEHRERDVEAFSRLLAGAELVDHETCHRTGDGQVRHLSFSARPLRTPEGEVRGAQGTARDVTDRVQVLEALRAAAEANSLVRSLINGTEDLIFYKDAGGVYQGCNHRFAEFLGRPEEEIVGKTDAELIDPERARAFRASDVEALTSWDALKFEEWVSDEAGGRRLMETVKTVFRHAGGEALGILGVVRDVTERKEAEERMRELAASAERATRMKSAFLANMSHEIRTPMNGVLGMTEILLDTDLSEEQRRSLEIIRSSGEALLRVLNDILDVSKIEAGHLELEEIPLDLHEAVLGAVQLFSLRAVERGSELMVDIGSDVPRGVRGDPTRLRQVLSNLVGNAVKFTPNGEILVTVTAHEVREEDVRLRFSVKDTGVGIPPEKQQAIFQEFIQADSSTTREHGGTGLGLTISRHLVSLMGGELELTSAPGHGSEFFFTLTLPRDGAFVREADSGHPVDLAGVRALLVDDVETNRRIFRDFLELAGAKVDTADGAEQALDLLRSPSAGPFDLVLLDLLMPGRDGFQLAEDIRLDPQLRDLPILILTSSNRPGDRGIATRLRVDAFLQKPVSRTDLLRVVQGALWPRGKAKAMGAPAAPATSERDGAAGPALRHGEGYRVLVAEDNLVNQQVAQGLLRKWGYEVILAGNGREVLELLETASPNVILMDVQMPEMDGLEATKRIRQDPRHASVPVLALTAHVLPEERAMCEEAGMDDYVPKPFKPEELRERLLFWARKATGGLESGPTEPVGPPPVLLEEFRATMRAAGIESVVGAALEAYLAETPGRMTALEGAVDLGNWDAVRKEAHGLKSGSRNIRADRLGDLLEELERAGAVGNGEQVLQTFPMVRQECESVMEYLRREGSST